MQSLNSAYHPIGSMWLSVSLKPSPVTLFPQPPSDPSNCPSCGLAFSRNSLFPDDLCSRAPLSVAIALQCDETYSLSRFLSLLFTSLFLSRLSFCFLSLAFFFRNRIIHFSLRHHSRVFLTFLLRCVFVRSLSQYDVSRN